MPQPISPLRRFFTSSVFRQASPSTQKAFFDAVSRRSAVDPKSINIFLQSQPFASEIQRDLQGAAQNAMRTGLPFGVVRLGDDSYDILRGNKEEIARKYFGLQNGLIDDNLLEISRAHGLNWQNGVKPGSRFYGGVGSPNLVLPYLISDNAGKSVAGLGDLYYMPDEIPRYSRTNLYKQGQLALSSYMGQQETALNRAFAARDLEKAADAFINLQAVPELNDPYLYGRLEDLLPKEKADLKYVPFSRQQEGRRMLRSFMGQKDFTEGRVSVRPVIDQQGRINFDHSRMRSFIGSPEKMGNNIIATYYTRPGISIATPDIVMSKGWNYRENKSNREANQDFLNLQKQLEQNGVSIPGGSITTDAIGNAYEKLGFDATMFPVTDFHQTFLQNGHIPSLFMVPNENIGRVVYPTSMYIEGLKYGGKINRFKSKLHK